MSQMGMVKNLEIWAPRARLGPEHLMRFIIVREQNTSVFWLQDPPLKVPTSVHFHATTSMGLKSQFSSSQFSSNKISLNAGREANGLESIKTAGV